jgi:hypothetical protein
VCGGCKMGKGGGGSVHGVCKLRLKCGQGFMVSKTDVVCV